MTTHQLRNEGSPFDAHRRRLTSRWAGVGGKGRALCSCGKLSPVLPSANQRKAWHRAHKQGFAEQAEVRFRRVTRGDRNALAKAMWEKDGMPERDPSDHSTVGQFDYVDDCHLVLQAAVDAGWKVEAPVGWSTRPAEPEKAQQ